VIALNVLLLLLLFLVVGSISYWAIQSYLSRDLEQRMEVVRLGNEGATHLNRTTLWNQLIQQFLGKFIRFSIPEEEIQLSDIRVKLSNAGYRGEAPLIIYYGIKTLFAFVVPAFYVIYAALNFRDVSLSKSAAFALFLCASGYYLPNFLLNYKIERRRQALFESFPDALDLIRICVASGLGIEAAVARVGAELYIISADLSEEFDILAMELRAGATRNDAFNNFAMRCGIEDIKALVAMLMQASRFGTSVSESLHVYSEGLRTKRKLLAQEAAAKIPVKLALPLILCIFPAIFVVILGPAVINLLRMSNPL
jgi:tight adherence protein C